MKKQSICIALAISIALAGCANSGVMVSEQQAAQFKKGVTTEHDIVAALGQPTITATHDGTRVLSYGGARIQARAASFIPIVGIFAGGADVNSSAVTFVIRADGLLEDTTTMQQVVGSSQH